MTPTDDPNDDLERHDFGFYGDGIIEIAEANTKRWP